MTSAPHGHSTHHGHSTDEDWNDEAFVAGWLERQGDRAAERQRDFALIRAVMPKLPDQEFRYLNLGSGPGNLDEVLLERFPGANATLVDFSLPMLGAARQRLQRFGERVEYVQANLARPDWTGGVGDQYDFVVSTLAVHHLTAPHRIRQLYAEVYRMLGHGGTFLNLDYMRPGRPSLAPLAEWAANDEEAGLIARGHPEDLPGTLLEHLAWLGEAGFGCVDVLWKDLSTSLICAVRDHLHIPGAEHPPTTNAGHGQHGHGSAH